MPDNPIKACIKEIGNNDGFYNLKKLLPGFDSTMVYFIIGERRIGKTDFFLHLACMLYQKYGYQTMWIRNKLVELKDPAFAASFLNDAKLRNWCPDSWETRPDGVYTASSNAGGEQVILFQSISTFSNRRGGANPKVLLMVFDEFMPEDRRYPKAAAKGLMSLTKTVFSGNTEARVFCLSNIVSAVNPYFARFRIYPEKDLTWYPEKAIVIEKCRGYKKAIATDNPWNKIYHAGNYGDYADESEDDILSLVVKRVPKGCTPYNQIIVANDLMYRMWRDDRYLYFAEYKGKIPNGSWLITAERESVSAKVQFMPAHFKQSLKKVFDTGFGRFVGANCLFDIMSIIYSDL